MAKVNRNNGCGNERLQREGRSDVPCWLPPIVFFRAYDKDIFNELLRVGLGHDHPPLLVYTLAGEDFFPRIAENKTVSVTIPQKEEIVSHVQIEYGQGGSNEMVVTGANLNEVNIKELPEEFKDDDYIEDLKYLRSLASRSWNDGIHAHEPRGGLENVHGRYATRAVLFIQREYNATLEQIIAYEQVNERSSVVLCPFWSNATAQVLKINSRVVRLFAL